MTLNLLTTLCKQVQLWLVQEHTYVVRTIGFTTWEWEVSNHDTRMVSWYGGVAVTLVRWHRFRSTRLRLRLNVLLYFRLRLLYNNHRNTSNNCLLFLCLVWYAIFNLFPFRDEFLREFRSKLTLYIFYISSGNITSVILEAWAIGKNNSHK